MTPLPELNGEFDHLNTLIYNYHLLFSEGFFFFQDFELEGFFFTFYSIQRLGNFAKNVRCLVVKALDSGSKTPDPRGRPPFTALDVCPWARQFTPNCLR